MQQTSMFEKESLTTPTPIRAFGTEQGRIKIEEFIKIGRGRAAQVIEYVSNLRPVDRVVKMDKITFEADGRVMKIFLPGNIEETIHTHAFQQASARCNIPWVYCAFLQSKGGWGYDLLASNLNELLGHMEGKALLRSVNGQVRAFLSDRYRRLDSRPIIDAFAQACKAIGAEAYHGYVTDTKLGIQAIIPRVYEPIKDELMAYGVSFENSDFGNGALSVNFFLLRIGSNVGMITRTGMRKIHLGARLEDDIEWSKKTHDLDQKTVISSINDLVKHELSEERINLMQACIKEASMTKLEDKTKTTMLELLKKFMTKGELEKALKKFNEPDIEVLPGGNNVWRLSNAVAWLSSETEDEERKAELMKLAGKMLEKQTP